jgi:hypothetical protein
MPAAGDTILASHVPGDWTTWSPTLVGLTSGGSIGNATVTARYRRVHDDVDAMCDIIVGSTTSFGTGTTAISLPVAAQATVPSILGPAFLLDTSASARRAGLAIINTTSNLLLMMYDGTIVNPTAPWTWATGDQLRFNIKYEAA